jgi:hypothetical protein
LLSFVACDGANNRVLLSLDTIHSAFDVSLGTGGVVFGFASGMLLLAGLLP